MLAIIATYLLPFLVILILFFIGEKHLRCQFNVLGLRNLVGRYSGPRLDIFKTQNRYLYLAWGLGVSC